MPSIRLPYFAENKLDPQTGNVIGKIFRPYVSIRLSFKHGNPSNFFKALLDSGSDRNLFPMDLGYMLKINFGKIKPVPIQGIGGITINAYPSPVNIWFEGKQYKTDADFSPEHKGTLLLGRQGFFNLFEKISFDEKTGQILVEI